MPESHPLILSDATIEKILTGAYRKRNHRMNDDETELI